MNSYFADFHIHIGRTKSGRPVKITASPKMDLVNVLETAAVVKGLDMIGIIDAHVPEIQHELTGLLRAGTLSEQENTLYYKKTAVIPGVEVELLSPATNAPVHVLCYMPGLTEMKEFSTWLNTSMKNPSLSTQRVVLDPVLLQEKVKEHSGIFIPAHVFTPFKSTYGKGVRRSLSEIFRPDLIDAVELGLSQDTVTADTVAELRNYPFLSNSDAHSAEKIAREYQKMAMERPSFQEWKLALREQDGRGITANFGLNPKLGKYYRTVCRECGRREDPVRIRCVDCGGNIVKGVYERTLELAHISRSKEQRSRPPYIYQVPLDMIPGIGPASLRKLRERIGPDMEVLHHASYEQLQEAVNSAAAKKIVAVRNGIAEIMEGGGGTYGKLR
ncbi:endonuclease Q family protein [Bacillus marinisedimentorum]|uniref:endonuclease Q family protein n=1 Tax=Bacillus marinisedimentorum TaxID=1821260 RepID=UPI0008729280|nr:endonuclease Q family protein [Bacillus marinisedimentorum]